MQLHKIIKHIEGLQDAVLIEKMMPYKKSLLTYFKNQFRGEPILLVVSVTNSTAYGLICPECEIYEALQSYDSDLTDNQIETILSYSKLLKDL